MRQRAGLPADPREQIHHPQLMIEDQQRDDITMRREIPARIESRPKVGEIQIGVLDLHVIDISVGNRRIAKMTTASSLAGDIPARPSFGDRAAMIGQVIAQPRQRVAVDRAWDALGEEAWHAQRRERVVALQATVVAKHRRWSGR